MKKIIVVLIISILPFTTFAETRKQCIETYHTSMSSCERQHVDCMGRNNTADYCHTHYYQCASKCQAKLEICMQEAKNMKQMQ